MTAPVFPPGYFNRTAQVFTPLPATGRWTVLDNSALACRLSLQRIDSATDGTARTELTGRRKLIWNSDYFMPEVSRVVIEGDNWNPIRGTFVAEEWTDGTLYYRRCEVQKAVVG